MTMKGRISHSMFMEQREGIDRSRPPVQRDTDMESSIKGSVVDDIRGLRFVEELPTMRNRRIAVL
jgi:hypothetical protein